MWDILCLMQRLLCTWTFQRLEMGLRWFIFTQWLWIVESMQSFRSMSIKNLYLVPVWNSLCKHSFPLGIELNDMWMDIRQNIKEHFLLRELRNTRIWFYSEFIFMWVKMCCIGCNLELALAWAKYVKYVFP